jgi:hypothetical protein
MMSLQTPSVHSKGRNFTASASESGAAEMKGPLFLLAFGVLLIAFNQKLGSYASRRWSAVFPRLPVGRHIYRASLLLAGLAFSAIGLLSMFGVIPLR